MIESVEELEREDRESADAALARWDERHPRRILLWLLSMMWFGVGNQAVFPLGALIALTALIPSVPAWGRLRSFAYTGYRP